MSAGATVIRAPRVGRWVLIELVAIVAIAVGFDLRAWLVSDEVVDPPREETPRVEEERVRVVRVERIPPPEPQPKENRPISEKVRLAQVQPANENRAQTPEQSPKENRAEVADSLANENRPQAPQPRVKENRAEPPEQRANESRAPAPQQQERHDHSAKSRAEELHAAQRVKENRAEVADSRVKENRAPPQQRPNENRSEVAESLAKEHRSEVADSLAKENRAPAPPQHGASRTIAAEKSDVAGVPLRVLIPKNPHDLEQHLRRAGGCLVVSELTGNRAEIMESFILDGGHARSAGHRACAGVPRLVRDPILAGAISDPVSQTRARLKAAGIGANNLVLQVVLSGTLEAAAQAAARGHLGTSDPTELAQRAAATGYAVRCYAQPDGRFACI